MSSLGLDENQKAISMSTNDGITCRLIDGKWWVRYEDCWDDISLRTDEQFIESGKSFEHKADAVLYARHLDIDSSDTEYGVGGYFVGVPCMLGAGGVEKVIELNLNDDERKLLVASVDHVKENVAWVDKNWQ